MIMRRRAAPGWEANLQQRKRRRPVKHLPRVTACAGDKSQGLVDGVDITAQSFKFFARGLHWSTAGASFGEAGDEFVYMHGGLLGLFGLFVAIFFIQTYRLLGLQTAYTTLEKIS
jgi:hypothetical protein